MQYITTNKATMTVLPMLLTL